MKILVNILLLLISLTSYKCYGQKKDGELIPILKHSYKIDSLLLGIVGNDTSFVTKYPCFSISVDRNDSVTFLSIYSFDKIQANALMTSAHLRNDHLGCFKLKDYMVFVCSSKKFDGLFSETKILTRINFIDFSHKIEIAAPPSLPIIPYLADFKYQNGKFSPMYGGK